MNGIELGIRGRQRFPSCEVLLFSGHAATTNLLAEARTRGYDFQLLTKPVHPRDLVERLNRPQPTSAKDHGELHEKSA